MGQVWSWYCVRTSGQFIAGHVYRSSQLGVTGRMAAKVGYLVPSEEVMTATKAPRKAVKPRTRRVKGGEQGSAQSGPGSAGSPVDGGVERPDGDPADQ